MISQPYPSRPLGRRTLPAFPFSELHLAIEVALIQALASALGLPLVIIREP